MSTLQGNPAMHDSDPNEPGDRDLQEDKQGQGNPAMHDSDPDEPRPMPPAPERKRPPRWLWLTLFVILILLVILSGSAANSLLARKPLPAAPPLPAGSAFVSLPLSQDQIYQIQHMPENMRARMLAQLYVSHMTLDEKLGQLIMAQAETWNDSANTPDTMYMLNQL